MPYTLSFHAALWIVGLFLVVLGGLGFLTGNAAKSWLWAFPRSRGWGLALLVLAAVWFWWLIAVMDLGEFAKWRSTIKIAIPVAAVLAAMYVEEFLAARALGMLVLLGAEPLLDASFLPAGGLGSMRLLNAFIYLAIIAAMFWIGMPYVLRDQVRWISSTPQRLRVTSGVFVAYGVVLLLAATLA